MISTQTQRSRERKKEDPRRCLWWNGMAQARSGNPQASPVLFLEEQMSRKTSVGHLTFLYGGFSFLRKVSESSFAQVKNCWKVPRCHRPDLQNGHAISLDPEAVFLQQVPKAREQLLKILSKPASSEWVHWTVVCYTWLTGEYSWRTLRLKRQHCSTFTKN